MKISLIAFVLFVPAFWVAGSSICAAEPRCAVPKFENEFGQSAEVFVGTVDSIEMKGDEKIATFQVEKYWKGSGKRILKVSAYENPKFQSPFREGGRFLVFAKADEDDDGKLFDGRCSRTTDLDRNPERAAEDLEKLGPGSACKGDGEECE
jgi:hypothetical protein